MKRSSRSRLVLMGGVAACLAVGGGVRAGSLTPPGPPAPTMKTLDQVEARTPISSLPYTITQSGSYYLTGNLQGVSGQYGIFVPVDDVTIDLNGFALIGVAGSESGIRTVACCTQTQNNLTIRNGMVLNWGLHGIDTGVSVNAHLEDLVVANNGTSGGGPLYGIILGEGMIRHVVASGNAGNGIALTQGSIVDSQAIGNGSTGIIATDFVFVANNEASQNAIGISVGGTGNRVESNHMISNATKGLVVGGSHNVVIRNTAVTNTGGNYQIGTGNDVGPIGTAATATSPWANISD